MTFYYLLTIVWVWVGVQSPFLLFCSSRLIETRWKRVAEPYLFGPIIAGVSLLYYFDPESNGPEKGGLTFYHYDHFLFAPVLILASYYLLVWRAGYSKPEGVLMSMLLLLAVDQLWQVPFDVYNWLTLDGFIHGIATAGWNFMAIPFFAYFVVRKRGKLQKDAFPFLLVSLFLTCMEVANVFSGLYGPSSSPYYLVFPWTAFFLSAAGTPPLFFHREGNCSRSVIS